MNAKTAGIFIPLHRPGRDGAKDSRVAKALRFAERETPLRDALARQIELDSDALAAIRAIALPESVRQRLGEIHARPAGKHLDWRAALRQPAFLAVVLAVLVLGWLFVREAVSRMQNFPGRDSVERMVEINDVLTGTEFELVATAAGSLGDWFVLKGLDRYDVPAEFAAFKAVACRVYRQDGFPVAQIAIQKDADNQMLFYVFRAGDFGVKLDEHHWRIFTEGEWVAAVRGHGQNVFMVAFKGDDGDMEKFLASTKAGK